MNQSYPSIRQVSDAIRVVAVAGYGLNPSDVPEPVRHAILLLVEQWYDNRGDTTEGLIAKLPFAVNRLLADYRRF